MSHRHISVSFVFAMALDHRADALEKCPQPTVTASINIPFFCLSLGLSGHVSLEFWKTFFPFHTIYLLHLIFANRQRNDHNLFLAKSFLHHFLPKSHDFCFIISIFLNFMAHHLKSFTKNYHSIIGHH